jgi:hypothetical protein
MICCITGMHRSGTSLTTSWLQMCGLVITDGPVVPPYPDNPKGFFEDIAFVHLHARSIQRRRRGTAGWKITPARSLEFSANETNAAMQLVATRQARHSVWGWKDPRSALFLPQWKQLIPSLKVIIVWRPAAEVVFSLLSRGWRHRNRYTWIGPLRAIQMWRIHNTLACEYAESQRRDTLVTPVSTLIKNDRAILNQLNERFNNQLTYASIDNIYDSTLMHSGYTPRWLRWLTTLAGCPNVEQRLQSLFEEPD